jgi:hypothetical protein
MEKSEAVELASDFARREGYDIGRYNIEAAKKDVRWEIYFQRKSADKPRPGDFFTVYVDDGSSTVQRLIPGK